MMCLHNQSLIASFLFVFLSCCISSFSFSAIRSIPKVMGLEGLMARPAVDDDLTNLNWLQDRDLLKDVRTCRMLSEVNENSGPAANTDRRTPAVVPPVAYDPHVHVRAKPPYSFSSLIYMAIESAPGKALPVKGIYTWIEDKFPFYRSASCGWKNTIRHNLSLSKCFKKVEKRDDLSGCPNSNGKGSLWSVDPTFRPSLLQSVKRAAFHVYPYMSTARPSLTAVPPVFSATASHKEVEAVHSMLNLTRANCTRIGDKIAGNRHSDDPSVDHNYSTKFTLVTKSNPVTVSHHTVRLPSHLITERRESYSRGEEKISSSLDDDDDGLKGAEDTAAEVLYNLSQRRLST